jgi:hypothetical protein
MFRLSRNGTQEVIDVEPTAANEPAADAESEHPTLERRRRGRTTSVVRFLALRLLPTVALLLAVAAGWLKWLSTSATDADAAVFNRYKPPRTVRWPC